MADPIRTAFVRPVIGLGMDRFDQHRGRRGARLDGQPIEKSGIPTRTMGLEGAKGAPKFATGSGVGFRVERLAD